MSKVLADLVDQISGMDEEALYKEKRRKMFEELKQEFGE